MERRHPGWTLAVVCTAVFMLLLDLTVVAVALGDLQTEFKANLSDLQWVVDAYTLPLAGLLLTTATLGDRIGRRRLFTAGLAVFTSGSLACALAWNALALDAFRAVQGVGASLLFGVALPLLGVAYPDPKRRAAAIGIFGATLTGATAVGPLVGGALVDGPGWRWIFLINVPIGIAALVVTRLQLAESRPENPRRADYPGTALLTAGLFALLLGLIRGRADGWGSAFIVSLFVAAGVLLAAFLHRQATAAQPMLDLSLFRSRSYTGVVVAVFALSAALIGMTTYISLYFLNTLDYSPFQAGLRFLPMTVVSFLVAPVGAQLGHRLPPRLTITAGLLITAVGMALMTRIHGDSSWIALIPGFVVAGLGMGLLGVVTSQAALGAVEPARAGMATGVVNTVRQVGIAAGVAVWGVLFQARVSDEFTAHTGNARLADAVGAGAGVRVAEAVGEPLRSAVIVAAKAAGAAGIDRLMAIGTAVSLLAAIAAFFLIRTPRPAPEATPEVEAAEEPIVAA
jgi:EmrB/QacA subfamily drug resistance transporter